MPYRRRGEQEEACHPGGVAPNRPVPDYLKPEVEVKVNIFSPCGKSGAAVLLLDKRAVLQKDDTRFAYVVEHGRAASPGGPHSSPWR